MANFAEIAEIAKKSIDLISLLQCNYLAACFAPLLFQMHNDCFKVQF